MAHRFVKKVEVDDPNGLGRNEIKFDDTKDGIKLLQNSNSKLYITLNNEKIIIVELFERVEGMIEIWCDDTISIVPRASNCFSIQPS